MIAVTGCIRGEAYKALVSFALEHSDALILIFRSYYGRPFKKRIRETRDMLKPYRIASRSNRKSREESFEWPGTVTWDKSLIHADLYRLSPEVREYALSVDDMFAWIYPDRPEDISFFYKGECWLSTTAHEGFCYIYDHESEITQLLDRLDIEYERDDEPCERFTEKYSF